jgi:ribonuclease HII
LLSPFYHSQMEAGTDEAGRGCLAGPVTAAAVILPQSFREPGLNDSKILSHARRGALKPIIELQAITFGVCHVFPEAIDQMNILNASIAAMHGALGKLRELPPFIVVDGNRFKPYRTVPHACIIKGDGKYMSIAAASVLAKTYRDAYMEDLHELHPEYNWKKNKGYPTREHREAIARFGITPHHRKSFRLLPEQLKMAF